MSSAKYVSMSADRNWYISGGEESLYQEVRKAWFDKEIKILLQLGTYFRTIPTLVLLKYMYVRGT
jgi:hypothetical protein